MSIRTILFGILLLLSTACSKEYYLFSYFQNNGEDGLHLAYSPDGKVLASAKSAGAMAVSLACPMAKMT